MARPFDEKKLNELGKKVMDAMDDINMVLQFPENLLDVEFSDFPDDADGPPIFGQESENVMTFTIRYRNTEELQEARAEHLAEVEEEILKMLADIKKKKGV